MTNVSYHLKQGKRLFGFTRSGASILGRFVLKTFAHRRIRQVISVGLIALLTFTFVAHNFANIGGASVLAVNLTSGTPNPVIDAGTLHTAQLPLVYDYESRGYSWFHSGADLVVPTGTPVHPIMEGVVEAVNHEYFGFGNHVIVKHDEGYESIYGHLSLTEVEQGQKVDLTTEIGKSGSTGFSTGPHLHLEIHKDGNPVDPADIVPGVK